MVATFASFWVGISWVGISWRGRGRILRWCWCNWWAWGQCCNGCQQCQYELEYQDEFRSRWKDLDDSLPQPQCCPRNNLEYVAAATPSQWKHDKADGALRRRDGLLPDAYADGWLSGVKNRHSSIFDQVGWTRLGTRIGALGELVPLKLVNTTAVG